MSKTNRNGVTRADFDKEVARMLKDYFLLHPTKKQVRTIGTIWRQGGQPSDAISYVLLSSNPVK